MRSDRELDELLGAYALDALDDDEQQEVDLYLLRSPRARAEVFEHQQVAAALGNSTAEAPIALWQRIEASLVIGSPAVSNTSLLSDTMSETIVDELPPLRALPSREARDVPVREVPIGEVPVRRVPKSAVSNLSSAAKPGPNRSGSGGAVVTTRPNSWSTKALGIAAAACIALLGANMLRLQHRLSTVRTQQAAVSAERDAVSAERDKLKQQVDTVTKTKSSIEAELVSMRSKDLRLDRLLADPTSKKVKLASTSGQELATIVIGNDGVGYLIAGSLPALNEGHTYQLWGVHGTDKKAKVLSLGVFGRNPVATPFAANDSWNKFVITEETGSGVVSSSPERAVAIGDVAAA